MARDEAPADGVGAEVSAPLPEGAAGVLSVPDGAQPATVPARERPAIPAKTLLRTDGLIKRLSFRLSVWDGAYGGVNDEPSVLVQLVAGLWISCGTAVAPETVPILLLSLAPGRLEG